MQDLNTAGSRGQDPKISLDSLTVNQVNVGVPGTTAADWAAGLDCESWALVESMPRHVSRPGSRL